MGIYDLEETFLTTIYGDLHIVFVDDSHIRVYHKPETTIQVGKTEIRVDIFLKKENNQWVFENKSCRKDLYSLYNNLPKTVNAKLEKLAQEKIIPFIKDHPFLKTAEIKEQQRNIERAEGKIKELEKLLKEQQTILQLAQDKLFHLENF